MNKKITSYSEAGVDIMEGGKVIDEIWKLLPKTFHLNNNAKILPITSHYGAIIDIGHENKYLVVKADGVGSKVLVAEILNKYDTIGIDCVAMNVNDLICLGAEPIVFVDYYAVEKPNPLIAKEIIKGLVTGATEAKMMVVGGETAILPDIIKGIEGKGFDLAGLAIGLVSKDGLITGEGIQVGDIIYGIASNGLHSNGFSLARKILLKDHSLGDIVEGLNLGEELLRPTTIYVQQILEIIKNAKIHGLANITGGSFLKLARLLRQTKKPLGIQLDFLPEPLPIFKLIQKIGKLSSEEMYKTFNMGVGFCIIAPSSEENKIREICQKHKRSMYKLGKVINEKRITLSLQKETVNYPADKF